MSKKAKNTGIKVVCSVLIVLLLAAIGISIPSKGFTDWSKFKPSKPGVEEPEKPGDESKPGDDDVVINQIEANGILLSATAASETEEGVSQLFTATITPDDATNKAVDWSVAFKDASSEWANGKNISDYVTVTPTSDGALTANVTCKAAFGEQIILTVVSRENAEAKATATVDYRKKVIDCEIKLNGDASGLVDFSLEGTQYVVSATPVMSIGTIENELTVSIQGRRCSEWYEGIIPLIKIYQNEDVTDTYVLFGNSFITNINFAASMLKILNYDDLFPKHKNEIKSYYSRGFGKTVMDIGVTYTGADGEFVTFTKAIKIGTVNFNKDVESVSLDKSSIIF